VLCCGVSWPWAGSRRSPLRSPSRACSTLGASRGYVNEEHLREIFGAPSPCPLCPSALVPLRPLGAPLPLPGPQCRAPLGTATSNAPPPPVNILLSERQPTYPTQSSGSDCRPFHEIQALPGRWICRPGERLGGSATSWVHARMAIHLTQLPLPECAGMYGELTKVEIAVDKAVRLLASGFKLTSIRQAENK